jgi:hypothetical protein
MPTRAHLDRRRILLLAVTLTTAFALLVPAALALTKSQAETYAFKRLKQRVKSYDDKRADYACLTAGKQAFLCTIVYYGAPDGGCFEVMRVSTRAGKVVRRIAHDACD